MTKPAPTRLLVVHPDEEARVFLRRRFSRLGHEVMEAAEHAKALSLVATIPFDLVLLDLQTPGAGGATGFDLLRRLRERRSRGQLPILAIAGEGAPEEAVEALGLGADDCVLRPLSMDVASARADMLIRRPGSKPAPHAARGELQARLERLQEASERTDAVSAVVEELGRDVRPSLSGLLGAASVMASVCRVPDLKPAIETIEAAAARLDLLVVRALGGSDRRVRAPKTHLRVLLTDGDAGSRLAMHDLLNATEVSVDLSHAAGGLEAALATDTQFFDLIVVNLSAPEAVAGIRAIRRAERQTRTRRTPILAVGPRAQSAMSTLDAGADLYVCEPVTAERLLGALADGLARESEDVRAVA